MKNDIWNKLNEAAEKIYKPTEVSKFIDAYHVVCAIESESGKIYTGFCIEGASGVINLCAERMAALNMFSASGETVVKRLLCRRDNPPVENGGIPCGACREFFMQLSPENKDMEIITDFGTRSIVTLEKIYPNWWGWKRVKE